MRTKLLYGTLAVSILALVTQLAFSAPPTSFYTPGETTDPTCSPGDVNCDVELPVIDTIYSANGTTGSGRTVGVTDTLNFDSNTFVVDGTNNRVGIGTSTPDESLQVDGRIKISNSGARLVLEDNDTADIDAAWLRADIRAVSSDGTTAWELGRANNTVDSFRIVNHDANGDIDFLIGPNTAASTKMTILANGNVGIGNETPSNILQVGPGNDAMFVSNIWTASRVLLGHPDLGTPAGRGGISYDRTTGNMSLISTTSGVLQNRIFIQWDGNIGIGTTTPDSKLSIVGLPSWTTSAVTPGSLVGAICITSLGNLYIDTDGTCSN